MPKFNANGQEIEVPAGATVLQSCELAGMEIARSSLKQRNGDMAEAAA